MVPLPANCRRVLLWGRVAFAIAGLLSGLLLSPRCTPWTVSVAGAYLIASLIIPFKGASSGAIALLVLFADLAFFWCWWTAVLEQPIWLPAFFYLYLVSEAVFAYRPPEVFVVVAVSAVFCIAVQSEIVFPLRRTPVVTGALACMFAWYRKRLESRMQFVESEASETKQAADQAQEAERQRIASDFHDGPLQSFISLQMRLEILRRLLERDSRAGMDDLRDLQNLAQQQVKELRAFVRSMRPPEMLGSNLYASARRICENFQKESGIPVSFVGGEGTLKFPEEMASEVIQMLREALHNVLKHAGATRVAVSLERVSKTLELSVDDNGSGFHFSGVYTLDELELLRLGPASFKRRARALNAEMTLESRPGRGAGLKLRVPIP